MTIVQAAMRPKVGHRLPTCRPTARQEILSRLLHRGGANALAVKGRFHILAWDRRLKPRIKETISSLATLFAALHLLKGSRFNMNLATIVQRWTRRASGGLAKFLTKPNCPCLCHKGAVVVHVVPCCQAFVDVMPEPKADD